MTRKKNKGKKDKLPPHEPIHKPTPQNGKRDNGAAMAAPGVLRMEGVDYWVSPLTDLDIAQLDEWIRAQFIANVRESLAMAGFDCTTPEYRADMAIAMREAIGLSWYSGMGPKVLATLDGMARLIWQSLLHRHPDMDIGLVRRYLTNPNNLHTANEAFEELNIQPFTTRDSRREEQTATASTQAATE